MSLTAFVRLFIFSALVPEQEMCKRDWVLTNPFYIYTCKTSKTAGCVISPIQTFNYAQCTYPYKVTKFSSFFTILFRDKKPL